MEILIWIIIMVAIVNNAKKKQKKAQSRGNYQARQPQQTYQRNVSQQSYQRNASQPQYQQMSMNMTQMQAAMTAKQQELKSRLQQKYPTAKGDILNRAAANTSDHNVDELELRAAEDTLNCVANLHNTMCIEGNSEESCLMKELNDLMLMGYQTDLSFERDFLSEGIDMLNSYEMPGI